MILIADSGSTKTNWSLVSEDSNAQSCITDGINPFFLSEKEIINILEDKFTLPKENITTIYFYGAGCIPKKSFLVSEALNVFFHANSIEVNSDLLAAAHSLCDKKEGIVCILGTGSNSGYYDGEKIIKTVSPLGYILGDEGSGAVLGKKLLAGILKNQMSDPVIYDFYNTYHLNLVEIMDKVYCQPFPNRFLAQFTPFIYSHISHSDIQKLVKNSFVEFIERNVFQYQKADRLPIHFTGSIAYYFKNILEEVCSQFDLSMGNTTKEPMSGLIKYHLKKN
ncbi:MAG: ATPase [Dysgonamonadaceae bacterium]|jgi:N-acetylglucosamine kinase-like BadF-type ATPase|nr:ATPase [Dysgonamonadaceae bacterium]